MIDILPNLFMTIEAKPGLCSFIETLMAFGALVFPLRMAGDDLAGH